jgi:quercetin dioxygenase-like cupin family protein
MNTDDRLRVHPSVRLAGAVQQVDLIEAAKRLRAEPHAATHGHRQIAIVRHGPVSIMLFVFDRGGTLKEHATEGEVTIHVLDGELEITLGAEVAVLGRGELVSFAPGQPHSVRAVVESEMLLTVCQASSRSHVPPGP